MRVLNRILTWTKDGISYDAGPRHVEIVISELGLKDAKGVVTQGAKGESTTNDNHDDNLTGILPTNAKQLPHALST